MYKMIINMKLKLYSATALIGIITLVSCAGNDKSGYVDKSIMPTAEEKAAAEKAAAEKSAASVTMPNTNAMPANLQPQQPNMVTVPGAKPVMVNAPGQQVTMNPQNNVVMTPVQTPVQPTAPGMNPPHGQPNHRCDIAVGAPLNSKPAPAQATPAAVQPQVTMKEVPNTTKTAPGMNPPHGEPNHRCDIAVGAPLNSKPAAPTTVTTTAPIAAPPPLIAPVKADSSKN
jgi:hypothetical protein